MSRTYNAQFLTIDFRLLDDPRYCAFMRSPAFSVYMLLRRYVWRSAAKVHPIPKVNVLFRNGFLAAAVPREVLAARLGVRGLPSISRHIAELEALGAIRKVKTGRQNVYVLGSWEDRSLAGDGRYVEETFFLDQLFGPEPFASPRLDEVAPGLAGGGPAEVPEWDSEAAWRRAAVEMGIGVADEPSEVSPSRPPEVSRMKPINRERNRERNTGERRPEPDSRPPPGVRRFTPGYGASRHRRAELDSGTPKPGVSPRTPGPEAPR